MSQVHLKEKAKWGHWSKNSALATALPDDVDEAVEVYNTVLSELLDKHAPLKTRSVAVRTPQPWMNNEIKEMKKLRRKYETLSKKYKHKSEHRHDHRKYCIIVRNLIVKAKEQYIMDKINRCQGDQKSLFNIVNSLLGRGKPTDLPRLQSPAALAEAFKEFFVNKIILIRTLLENMESTMSPLSVDLQSAMCRSANKLEEFTLCSTDTGGHEFESRWHGTNCWVLIWMCFYDTQIRQLVNMSPLGGLEPAWLSLNISECGSRLSLVQPILLGHWNNFFRVVEMA